VRFVTVFGLLVGAAWAAGVAVRDTSSVMWMLAGGLVLLALIIAVSGGRKRRERKEAAAAAAAMAAAVSIPRRSDPNPAPEPVAGALAAQDAQTDLVVSTPETDADTGAAADAGTVAQTSMADLPDVAQIPYDVPAEAPSVPDELSALPDSPESAEPSEPAASRMDVPAVRTPFSVQPAVVLMSLYDAIAERFETDATHLWLEDGGTATLRLVAAFGPRVPKGDPLQMSDNVLGRCAATRSAVFDALPIDPTRPDGPTVWRYAVPVGTPEVRGVAGVDLVCADREAAAFVLNEVSGALRASLTAALAVHVARSEMDTAVLLLTAAQELTSGIGGDEILSAALDSAMQLAGATTGSVMLPDGPDGALRIVASRGLPADIVASASVEKGEGIAGTVYSTHSPLLVEDLPGRAGERRHGVQSSVSIPIFDENGTLGVLNVGARAFPARLTDAYVRALGLLGSQTAMAMRNVRAAERSWDSYLDNLQALATALEFDDPYRRGASRRIAQLTVALGEAMGLDGEEIVSLRIAAILHDVGMGLATGSVGSTDRPLSTVDRGLVRAHPKVAYDVMQQVPSLEQLAPVVRHHHERFDGDGYDTGLSGTSIPLGSRVLAVADAFVAMTSARPYRDALGVEAALDELNAGAGAQFDPEVVDAFIALLERRPDLLEAS